ncbi:uncharacterized protein [Procambarus clarkii]|uniref:uncharacterized protein n=1 Tax=Procambarus clarkii TaxID=6728 RepID=UPI003743BFAB
MCGADCWTDRRLIVSKCKLCILPTRRLQGQKTVKKLNDFKLKSSKVVKGFCNDLESRMLDTPQNGQDSIKVKWAVFRDAVYSTALEHIGPATHRKQDWFNENSEEIHVLFSKENHLFCAHQNDPTPQGKKNSFASARRMGQRKLRVMQDEWFSKKPDNIQGYTVLNHPALINVEAIARHLIVKINQDLNKPPTKEEVRNTIKQLSYDKAPGSDAIPAEVYTTGGPIMRQKLTKLFQSMWNEDDSAFNAKWTAFQKTAITSVPSSAPKRLKSCTNPCPEIPYQEPLITVKRQNLQPVDSFT